MYNLIKVSNTKKSFTLFLKQGEITVSVKFPLKKKETIRRFIGDILFGDENVYEFSGITCTTIPNRLLITGGGLDLDCDITDETVDLLNIAICDFD